MRHRNVEIVDMAIIHCADTKTSQKFSIKDVRDWHIMPKHNTADDSYTYKGKRYNSRSDLPESVRDKKGNGWSDIGYHYYIGLDGVLELGRPIWNVGSHAYGKNTKSIGICLEGGKNADGTLWDKPLQAQEFSLKMLLEVLKVTIPKMTVHGHYEFSSKTCPNYNIDHLK